MDIIRLKNFRCFREEQTARLAPLTLLVGENSTGKTSFMAMIRALLNVFDWERSPDFKENPYDLGSFDEIAHYQGGKGGRADSFEAGFEVLPKAAPRKKKRAGSNGQPFCFDVAFEKGGSAPVLKQVRFAHEDVWFKVNRKDRSWETSFGTPGGSWRVANGSSSGPKWDNEPGWGFYIFRAFQSVNADRENETKAIALEGSKQPDDADLKLVKQFEEIVIRINFIGFPSRRPFASAPVRSKPRRTYDPARLTPDPEGDYIPMYLANLSHQDQDRWQRLKKALEDFGREAGLFDEIYIRHLGKRDSDSEPFQVQVRKSGRRLKGPRRNLIDVGYGVSQVLPVITELFQTDAPRMFLLQQPEVHLHPSAQAALGSLFCQIASSNRQLIVETHSDHLLDRVRMDVRDGEGRLKPDDVSILFFERDDLHVRIHSLRLDEEGNVLDAPDSYRKFFMEETRRSLWKR